MARKRNMATRTDIQDCVERLKQIFSPNHSNASLIFGLQGYTDFFFADNRIGGGIEEKTLNINQLKGLVLRFLEKGFFEPIFILENGDLRPLIRKRKNARSDIKLYPHYVWAKECFPYIRPDFLDIESQLEFAKKAFFAELNFLNDLLAQLKYSEAIICLVIDEALTKKSRELERNDVWKIVIYRFQE